MFSITDWANNSSWCLYWSQFNVAACPILSICNVCVFVSADTWCGVMFTLHTLPAGWKAVVMHNILLAFGISTRQQSSDNGFLRCRHRVGYTFTFELIYFSCIHISTSFYLFICKYLSINI